MLYKSLIFAILPVLVFTLSGCGTMSPQNNSENRSDMRGRKIAGEIESVNEQHGYVVIRCELAPPPGVEAKVIRNRKQVASVRFSKLADYPCFSADIISGEPSKGDLVVY